VFHEACVIERFLRSRMKAVCEVDVSAPRRFEDAIFFPRSFHWNQKSPLVSVYFAPLFHVSFS
jgi:hypothetical protein